MYSRLFRCGRRIKTAVCAGSLCAVSVANGEPTLPAFVVMTSSDKGKTCGQPFFDYYWGSGFLPSRFQGVKFRNTGEPVPYLANPAGRDQPQSLFTQLAEQCGDTDAPSAALIQDLKDRGLLDDTLVVWGGEFGRTPFGQGDPNNPKGRDHFGKAYSFLLCGGGVKPGTVYGATDDYAWNIVADPVHIHDMQATIMHLVGIDHTRLTFRYQGRQFRITDVHGNVVTGLIA